MKAPNGAIRARARCPSLIGRDVRFVPSWDSDSDVLSSINLRTLTAGPTIVRVRSTVICRGQVQYRRGALSPRLPPC